MRGFDWLRGAEGGEGSSQIVSRAISKSIRRHSISREICMGLAYGITEDFPSRD